MNHMTRMMHFASNRSLRQAMVQIASAQSPNPGPPADPIVQISIVLIPIVLQTTLTPSPLNWQSRADGLAKVQKVRKLREDINFEDLSNHSNFSATEPYPPISCLRRLSLRRALMIHKLGFISYDPLRFASDDFDDLYHIQTNFKPHSMTTKFIRLLTTDQSGRFLNESS